MESPYAFVDIVKKISARLNPVSSAISGLYDFSSLYKRIEKTNKFFEEINTLSEEEYNERFRNKVERAEALGTHGWVIGQHMQLGAENEALVSLENKGSEAAVLSLFYVTEGVEKTEIDDLKKIYNGTNLAFYLERFEAVYSNQDYTSAAFYLCSILERRVKIFANTYRKLTRLIEEGIPEEKKSYFNTIAENRDQGALDLYVLTEYIPSLKTYIERVFVDGIYTFENGVEPPYLNRNWLVHGMITKPVEKYQVLQLLNAIDTLEVVIDAKNKLNEQ